MTTSVKWILGIVVLVVLVWVGFSMGNRAPKETEPIKIGIVAAMTGDYAFVGEAVKNGAQAAVDEINADPKTKLTYELVVEDDGFDPAKTVSAVNKLISVDKVVAFMTMGSGGGNVAAPVAESEGVVHVGMASDPAIARGDLNFIHWTQPKQEVEVFVDELIRRNLSRIALVSVNQQGYQEITDEFKKKIEGTDIMIVYEETFNAGLTDFKTIIAQAKEANPDIIYLGTFDPETMIFGTQLKDMGVKIPLTSIESFGLTADPSVFEGYWFVDSVVPTNTFASEYKNRYGTEPGPGAANAYDIVKLLARAAEDSLRTGAVNSVAIAESLQTIQDYSGALGPLEVDPEGVILSQPSLKVIRGGKAVVE